MNRPTIIKNDTLVSFFEEPTALRIWLPGRVVSKLRPRFGKGTAFLHPNYRNWKNAAVSQISWQLKCNCQIFDIENCMVSHWPLASLPISPAKVSVLFVGAQRGDCDNRLGSILDCLVTSGILANDTARHNPIGKYETVTCRLRKGALVIVEPATVEKFHPQMLLTWGR